MDNEIKKMFELLMNKLENITYKVLHTEGTINKIGEVINDSRAIK
jgi:hypothetical protein